MSKPKSHRELAMTQAVGARTVVMDRPPEMTMVPGPDSLRTIPPIRAARDATSATPSIMTTTVLLNRGAPRSAPPPPPRPLPPSPPLPGVLAKPVQPPPIPRASAGPQPPKPMPARTRMVDVRDALANQGLPPLPIAFAQQPQAQAPAGDAAPASLQSMPRSASPWMRVVKERRSLLVAAGGALLLLMLLLLPQLTGESEAEALEQQASANAGHVEAIVPAPAVTASSPDPAPGPMPDPASGTDAKEPLSEAQAGALLLSGQRAQALASYRALAQKPGAHPGIGAMVIVLEQKVNPL